MIVKKMPILQGFPDFETVKNLSGNGKNQVDFAPLFYDIETTGLGRNSSFLYMIGAVCYEGNEGWQLYQWLAPDFREEKQLLEVFSEFLKKFTCTVQYNGDAFDQPYLQARLAFHELPDPFEGLPSIDLYKDSPPLKRISEASRTETGANGSLSWRTQACLLQRRRLHPHLQKIYVTQGTDRSGYCDGT